MELPADFLSPGMGSVKLVSEPGLGDSSLVFPIELFFL